MLYKNKKNFPVRALRNAQGGTVGLSVQGQDSTPSSLRVPSSSEDSRILPSGCSLGLLFWNSNNQTLIPDMRLQRHLKSKCSLKWLNIKSVLQRTCAGMFSQVFVYNTVTIWRFTHKFLVIYPAREENVLDLLFPYQHESYFWQLLNRLVKGLTCSPGLVCASGHSWDGPRAKGIGHSMQRGWAALLAH